MHTTANELVFGFTLCLPGELSAPSRPTHLRYGDYAKCIVQHMQTLQADSPRGRRPLGCNPNKSNVSTYLFMRVDSAQTPSQPTFACPFCVAGRGRKSSILEVASRQDTVSNGCIKPATMEYKSNDGYLSSHEP